MELATMLRAVGRRWWVVLVVLGLTALLAVQTVGAFPPTYVVEGDYLLTRGDARGTAGDTATSPAVIAAVAQSRGFGDDAPAPFEQMPYAVAPVDGSSVITLTTTWSQRTTAVQGLDRLVASLEDVVDDLVSADAGVRGATVTVTGRGVSSATTTDTEDGLPTTAGFTATATVLVETAVSPASPFEPTDYTADVLTSLVGAPLNVANYLERPGVDDFVVESDPRRPAPLVTLMVEGTDREAVLAAYADGESDLDDTLAEMQAVQTERGATPTVTDPLARPDGPTVVENNLRRPLAVVVLLGLFIAMAAALSVDALLSRRRPGGGSPRSPDPAATGTRTGVMASDGTNRDQA